MVRSLVTRSLSLLTLFAVLAAAALSPPPAAAQDPSGPEPEAEHTSATFEPLSLEPEIFAFPDEMFTEVALKITLGTASIQERRWWYRAAERYAPFQGSPPADARMEAWEGGQALAASGDAILNWHSLGPNGNYEVSRINGGPGARDQGRATALWTHMEGPIAVNKDAIFLGFADAGVWKSLDGGEHWEALTDFEATLSIGALDVLPGLDLIGYTDATIYVGTGEGNFSVVDKDGVGVLKSTDGGRTWAVQPLPYRGDDLGQPGLHRIRRLKIDRNVPGGQSVWVAGDGGVYHTADGGASWQLVTGLPYSSAPAGAAYPGGCWVEYATDFVVDAEDTPQGHSTLFAAFGRISDASCVTPAADARKNNGVFRSVDGGNTWQNVSSATNGFPATPGLVGRITLLSAPSNPKHLYALIANTSNQNTLGIFDTLDATASPVQWTAGSTRDFARGQGWYNLIGSVHPTDENSLIVAGIDNWLSTNRGQSLTQISSWSAGDQTWSHADHHNAVWVDDTTYYDANDGGFHIGTIDGTNTTWVDKNGDTLSTLQFYGLSQSASDAYKINAGLQDNGHALLAGGRWQETYGGDGGFAATDQTDDTQAYEEYVYAAIRHSDTGGDGWRDDGCMQTFGGCPGTCGIGTACIPDQHTAFIANFMLDAHNQNIMYVGSHYLCRNPDASNAGKVWERIATDGLAGDFVLGATSSRAYISIVHTPEANRVGPVGIGLAEGSQILYVGTSTGRIWRSDDGGASWSDVTQAPLPVVSPTAGRFLTWIGTDPTNADRVVVTYSGWAASTSPVLSGHVFRSNDGGGTWTDISGALPDEPFNTLAVNPNPGRSDEIFVASDTGVYLNRDGWTGDTWVRINNGLLPHVSVNMLEFTNATEPRRLRAATHGRGIWELFEQTEEELTFDRPAYGCSDAVAISLLTTSTGAGSLAVTVTSVREPAGETVVLSETPLGSGHYVGSLATGSGAAISGDGEIAVFNADELAVSWSQLAAGALVDCSTCDGSTAPGGNLRVDEGSVTTSIDGGGGDGDEFLDNCETATVGFSVSNVGAGSLSDVRIAAVTSSNPAVRIQPMPVAISGQLAQCTSASGSLGLTADGLAAGESLVLDIEVTSNEMEALGVRRAFTVRWDSTEQDFVFVASRTWSFESDLEDWTVAQGTFTHSTENGGAGVPSSAGYLTSSALTGGVCDEVRSPVVKLTPTSTLEIYNQFAIEPLTDAWYDRANIGLHQVASGDRDTIVPGFGRLYTASGANGTCVTGGQEGWAGPGPGWLPSQWSATDLDAATRAGDLVQVSAAYGTDPLVSLLGLQIDEVTLTDFELQGADAQGDFCPLPCPEAIGDDDPSIEYTGGWQQKDDPGASGGSHHSRVGKNPRGSVARVEFESATITYVYGVSTSGGLADIYIDGAFVETLSYAGQGQVTFGQERVYDGLGVGTHVLEIVHRSHTVYVDGFRFDCQTGSGPDASAAQLGSETTSSQASASEGAVIERSIVVGPETEELAVIVEGSVLPVTVQLIGPAGALLATGGQLQPGLSISGLDAVVSAPGTYRARVVNTLGLGERVTISFVETVRK